MLPVHKLFHLPGMINVPLKNIDISCLDSLQSISFVLPFDFLCPLHLLRFHELLEQIPLSRNLELIHIVLLGDFRDNFILAQLNRPDTDWKPVDDVFTRLDLSCKIRFENVNPSGASKALQEGWEAFVFKRLPSTQQLGILSTKLMLGKASLDRSVTV
jgi:hypothetical protein